MITPTERPQHSGDLVLSSTALSLAWRLCEGCRMETSTAQQGLQHSFQKGQRMRTVTREKPRREEGLFHLLMALSVTPQVSNPLVQNRSLLLQTKIKRDFNQPEFTLFSDTAAERPQLNTLCSRLGEDLSYRLAQADVWKSSPPP